jgi:thiamine transport system permease protein
MAPRALALISTGLVAAFVFIPLSAVFWRAGGSVALGEAELSAIRFTVWQAFFSALISCLLAIPAARALARRRFFGRETLITLLGAPFILPTIVAILGLLAVFGREGIFNQALLWLGLPRIHIYGLHGVILAHVFFNLPLAIRLLLQGWQSIPAERFRAAAQLGFTTRTLFRVLEWPMLRQSLPGAFLVIFVICLSSFAVALTLGGGPKSTTVELAIYQAFRFDFDLGKAATLALIQLVLVGIASIGTLRLIQTHVADPGHGRPPERWDSKVAHIRIIDATVLILVAGFLMLPILSIVWNGMGSLHYLPASVWMAAGNSLMIAQASTVICISLALPLATGKLGQSISLLGFALSPLVLGTGLFLLIQPFASPFSYSLVVTCLVNALMGLPFAVRAIAPVYAKAQADFSRSAEMLGLRGFARWRWVILPCLRRPIGFAAGLTAALSMGDLGVIVLFADPERATLPLQMYRLMSAYQMDTAAAAALLLLILSLGLFWLFDKGGRYGSSC